MSKVINRYGLNITLAGADVTTDAIECPENKSMSLQIVYDLDSSTNTVATLLQTNDGENFNEVVDSSGEAVTVELDPDTTSATINIAGLICGEIAILFDVPADETGSIDELIIASW